MSSGKLICLVLFDHWKPFRNKDGFIENHRFIIKRFSAAFLPGLFGCYTLIVAIRLPMMFYRLNTLFELTFPDVNFRLLLLIVSSLFITWWFLLGLLNPFIDAAAAIVKTALVAILTVFFGIIETLSDAIDTYIRVPIHRLIQKIPISVKIVFYLLLGLVIFAGDQLYGKQLFEFDETIQFYRLSIEGQSYWVSIYALVLSGFFVSLAALYSIGVIWKTLKFILDQPVRISVVVRK